MDFALKQRTSPFRLPSNHWLIFVAALAAFSATFGFLCWQEVRARDERLAALDAQVRFAVISVDTKIEIELQQLRDLAASSALQRRTFESFYEEARAFAVRTRRQVVLHDVRNNSQIFNTAYPLHARLQEGARFLQKSELDRVKAGQPYISNLFYAALAQKNLIAVAVPVPEGGEVRYLLGVALDPAEILFAVTDATFAKATVTSIIDRNGVILARSAENDKYAGRKAPSNATERAEKGGRFKGNTFDGVPINLAYLQSDLTGWAAVSFDRDATDTQWPYVAGLLAALLVVVIGFLRTIVSSVRKRERREKSKRRSSRFAE